MGNQKQLQLSAHMLWPFQFQNYLPGPRYQVLAINPICHDPHILVDSFLKPNLCRIYVMTTFPRRVIRMYIFQQPVYIHLIQDLLLTTKKATTKNQSTSQLFLKINHIVSALGQLMPSHFHLTKSATTSYNTSYKKFTLSSQNPTKNFVTTMICHTNTQDRRRAEASLRRRSRV